MPHHTSNRADSPIRGGDLSTRRNTHLNEKSPPRCSSSQRSTSPVAIYKSRSGRSLSPKQEEQLSSPQLSPSPPEKRLRRAQDSDYSVDRERESGSRHREGDVSKDRSEKKSYKDINGNQSVKLGRDYSVSPTYYRRRSKHKSTSPPEVARNGKHVLGHPQEKIPLNNSCSSMMVFDNYPDKVWSNIIMEQVREKLSQSGSSSLNTSREPFISTSLSNLVNNDKKFFHYKVGMHKCTSKKRVQGPYNVTERPDVDVPNGVLENGDHNENATLCQRAFMNILASEEFRLMCSRLHENFGGVEVDKFFDFNLVISRMMHGAYGCSPVLFSYDIEQVWSGVRKVLREMLSIVNDLSECSKACCDELLPHHQPKLGECSVATVGPKSGRNTGPKTRHTVSLAGSDHDNCVVCARMNPEPGSLLTGRPEEGPGGTPDRDGLTDVYSSYRCGICRGMAEVGEKLRVCSHPHCFTKYYHPRCLTAKESASYGPLWYCPSCLCRRCLVDQDDPLMVLCDGCNHGYHIYCMDPPLGNIPRGRWFCHSCGEGLCRLMDARAGFREEEAEKRNARAERRVYTAKPGSTRGVHQVVVVRGKNRKSSAV